MRSRQLPRRPFHADSLRARGPVLALSPPSPSLPCARAAEEARGAPGRCAIGAAGSGRVTAPPVDSGAARRDPPPGRAAAGAPRSAPSTTPSRRSTIVAGGLQRRGGLRPPLPALCSAPPPNRGAARIASISVLHLLHRIGSLQAPSLSALCFSFSVHVAHHDREEIREGRETGMCT